MTPTRLLTRTAIAAALLSSPLFSAQAIAQNAICYNCPPEWADWGTQLKAIKAKTGISVPPTTRTPARRWRSWSPRKPARSPTSTYYGVTFAHPGAEGRRGHRQLQAGRLERHPRRPQGPRRPLVHHPLGHARLHGQRRCAEGQAGAEIVGRPAQARVQGPGRLPRPGLGLRRLRRRGGGQPGTRRHARQLRRRPSTTSRRSRRTNRSCRSRPRTRACCPARSRSCSTTTSTPIVPSYKDKANVEFVIPAEGTVVVPYVMSLVAKSAERRQRSARLLDFILSDEGQALWANAFLRPVRASAMLEGSPGASSCRPPITRAPRRSTTAGWRTSQKAFSDRYLKECTSTACRAGCSPSVSAPAAALFRAPSGCCRWSGW